MQSLQGLQSLQCLQSWARLQPLGPAHNNQRVRCQFNKIEGTVYIDAAETTPLTIQFFSSPAADPSGHGEGKPLLGGDTSEFSHARPVS